jgi:hypothetical protein
MDIKEKFYLIKNRLDNIGYEDCLEILDSQVYYRQDTTDNTADEQNDDWIALDAQVWAKLNLYLADPYFEHDCITGNVEFIEESKEEERLKFLKSLPVNSGSIYVVDFKDEISGVYSITPQFISDFQSLENNMFENKMLSIDDLNAIGKESGLEVLATAQDFCEALDSCMNKGLYIAREDSFIKETKFIFKVPGTLNIVPNEGSPYSKAVGDIKIDIQPHLDCVSFNNIFQPGWVPSQEDLFAKDWVIFKRIPAYE